MKLISPAMSYTIGACHASVYQVAIKLPVRDSVALEVQEQLSHERTLARKLWLAHAPDQYGLPDKKTRHHFSLLNLAATRDRGALQYVTRLDHRAHQTL